MTPSILFVLVAAASTTLAEFVPIHGCEWVPSSTAIKDFVFLSDASNTSAISWNAPTVSASCKTANATWHESEGHEYSVPCSPPENGMIYDVLRVSGDGKTASIRFRTFAQCAADIFAFHYEAVFPLDCTEDSEGSTSCVAKGNVTADCTAEQYLPPMGYPPPCYRCGRSS
ncbi:uncharacterized protein CC84DRAFT_1201311 [Paraphaeosphaeria sporulosa]|uniref:AA1-like domain-containing protein n=1 Tax=Paraphaeosphaeria sporulosa TaxID=1460663 RepID=A0A177CYJ9_9PLEO|nr:uncharacterized protein CC84DRAFT_1201311 [Paraphaeosphaeria sporulosa]OAG12271.1 hypothetical protein CC84DRAFT_1201311 [Paraphaeosphaeria sporulosa]